VKNYTTGRHPTFKNKLYSHEIFFKIIPVFCPAFPGLVFFGQKKQVCFSFDDLPLVTYGTTDTSYQKKIFTRLILSWRRMEFCYRFVNEVKLYNNKGLNQFQVGLLTRWIDNGLEVGNHTFLIQIIMMFHLKSIHRIFWKEKSNKGNTWAQRTDT